MRAPSTETFTRRVLIILGLSAFAVVLALLLWRAAGIFLLAFAGLLLAVFFHTLANLLSRYTPLSGGWSLAAVLLLLAALLASVGWLIGPSLAGQVDQLLQQLPSAIRQFEDRLGQYGWGRRLLEQVPSATSLPLSSNVLSRLTGTLSTLWTVVLHVTFILFFAIFLASTPHLYRSGLIRLVPPKRRARADEVVGEVVVTLQAWLFGKLISMAVVGVLTALGLWLLGMPLVLTLGLLAGLLEFIPFFGPYFSSLPAILLALAESPLRALYVALLYVVVQQIEGNLVLPIVHQKTVDLPPALTITAVLVMGGLFGFVGLLVATPVTAVALVLVKMLYLEDTFGEHPKLPKSPLG